MHEKQGKFFLKEAIGKHIQCLKNPPGFVCIHLSRKLRSVRWNLTN